ncbi:MAG TPA: TadE family protein [Vicinamibacterales bacterium]|nr:TadE family protein [Vicinamibacterales bacterium]
MAFRRRHGERGAALVEAAVTIPILLLVAVGIFEFGRAYQFWQVLTNAARESARYSVTPNAQPAQAQAIAVQYMQNGGLAACGAECVTVNRNVPLGVGNASTVTIAYPFEFMVLKFVAPLVRGGSDVRESLTMRATATMRNEEP